MIGYGLALALPMVLALTVAYLKFCAETDQQVQRASVESVRAASESAVALLSYRPDTVQNDLDAAKNRLTGSFHDTYSDLVDDVVAPAAIQKLISAQATVSAAASVLATSTSAVVLVYVDQKVTVGDERPTTTSSSIRVNLELVDGRWLVSAFDPV